MLAPFHFDVTTGREGLLNHIRDAILVDIPALDNEALSLAAVLYEGTGQGSVPPSQEVYIHEKKRQYWLRVDTEQKSLPSFLNLSPLFPMLLGESLNHLPVPSGENVDFLRDDLLDSLKEAPPTDAKDLHQRVVSVTRNLCRGPAIYEGQLVHEIARPGLSYAEDTKKPNSDVLIPSLSVRKIGDAAPDNFFDSLDVSALANNLELQGKVLYLQRLTWRFFMKIYLRCLQ